MTKGIAFNGRKWIATLCTKREHIYLGSFDTEVLAKEAWDVAKVSSNAKLRVNSTDTTSIYKIKPNGRKYVVVHWNSRYKLWRAQIWLHDEIKHLGSFKTKHGAVLAYQAFESGNFNYKPPRTDGRSLRYKAKFP